MRSCTWSVVMVAIMAIPSRSYAQVVFAEFNGSVWSYSEIDPVPGTGNSLVFDATGNPHVTYTIFDQATSTNLLRYATRSSGTWSTRTLENLGSPPNQFSMGGAPIPTTLAINPVTMRPNVFYLTQANATPTSYRYGEINMSGFVSEPVDTAGSWYASDGRYSSLAIDSTGRPHVAYWKEPGSDLLYAVRNGGAWSSTTVATDRIFFSSLALNPVQAPGIAYYRERVDGPNFRGELFYASLDNGVWQSEFVDGASRGNVDYVGYQPSLAFGPDSKPRIAYTDIHGGLVKYAVKSGSQWEADSLASIVTPVNVFSSLVTDGNSALTLYSNGGQYLASQAGGLWSSESVGPASGAFTWNSLALNGSNQPAFVYTAGIPEPSTLILAACGLAYAGWGAWRRKAAA